MLIFWFILSELKGGRFFFKLTKEGDGILFASDDNADSLNWLFKLYMATGQTFKPILLSYNADEALRKVEAGIFHSRWDIFNLCKIKWSQELARSILGVLYETFMNMF